MSAADLAPAAAGGAVPESALRRFVVAEGRLLDEEAYDAWLALWDPAGVYWIPRSPDAAPADGPHLAYEDHGRLRDRVQHLVNGNTYANYPKGRHCRMLSSFAVARGETAQSYVVRCNFLLVTYRRSEHQLLAGGLTHHVRQIGDGEFRILRKKVDLLSADGGNRNFIGLL